MHLAFFYPHIIVIASHYLNVRLRIRFKYARAIQLNGDTMREKISNIWISRKSASALAVIPSDIVKDSTFPFKLPCRVNIRIDGKRLILEEAKE